MTRKGKAWKFQAKEDKNGEAKPEATQMKDKLKQCKIMKENVMQRKMTHEKEKAIGEKATECEKRKLVGKTEKNNADE